MFRLARSCRWLSCSIAWTLLAVATFGCSPDGRHTGSSAASDPWDRSYYPFEDGEWGPDGVVGDHEPYAGQGCLEVASNRWSTHALGRLVPTAGVLGIDVKGWCRLVADGPCEARVLLRVYDEVGTTHAAIPNVPEIMSTREIGRVDESASSWTEMKDFVDLRRLGNPAFVRLEWVLDHKIVGAKSAVLYADEFLISRVGQP